MHRRAWSGPGEEILTSGGVGTQHHSSHAGSQAHTGPQEPNEPWQSPAAILHGVTPRLRSWFMSYLKAVLARFEKDLTAGSVFKVLGLITCFCFLHRPFECCWLSDYI